MDLLGNIIPLAAEAAGRARRGDGGQQRGANVSYRLAVGFVGAAESKTALMEAPPAPALSVLGRLGGSAVTVAAVNALATRSE